MSMIGRFVQMTPKEFEEEVRVVIAAAGYGLKDFQTEHREKIGTDEGDYEIDITARFEALGVEFLVLIECKHQRSRVKRESVQVLYDRIRSTGAHKGIIFSTAQYQRGAIEYASKHRIALVTFVDGKSTYMTRAHGNNVEPPPWADIPKYVGWLTKPTKGGSESFSIVSRNHGEYLRKFMTANE